MNISRALAKFVLRNTKEKNRVTPIRTETFEKKKCNIHPLKTDVLLIIDEVRKITIGILFGIYIDYKH